MQPDNAEIILHSLDYHYLNELAFWEITDLLHSVIAYLRETRGEHRFSLLLFDKAMEFAKWTDLMHHSRNKVDEKHFAEMMKYLPFDDKAVQEVHEIILRTYPELMRVYTSMTMTMTNKSKGCESEG